jgi:CRISPR/Cas system-associated endonuclease Cas1
MTDAMDTIKIEIVNHKAMSLIQNLAKMDLIRIKKENAKSEFVVLLEKLRKLYEKNLSLDEITKEVELVRSARHAT